MKRVVVMDNIYVKSPLTYIDDIPVFTIQNEYTDNYEKISADHIEVFKKEGLNPFIPEDMWRTSEESTKQLISTYARQGQKVLDVGVGMGRLLEGFEDLDRYGMDISTGYLKIASKKGIKTCYSMIEDMPYKTESFDMVICTDVLEHVIDLHLCITNIVSVLKQEGILVLRVPYCEPLEGYLKPEYPYKFAHLRTFDEWSLRIIFEKIYNCKYVDSAKAVYYIDPQRIKYALPARRYILKALAFSKHISKGFYNACLMKIFNPVEINMVFQKKC